jgi:hypothetical protein
VGWDGIYECLNGKPYAGSSKLKGNRKEEREKRKEEIGLKLKNTEVRSQRTEDRRQKTEDRRKTFYLWPFTLNFEPFALCQLTNRTN